MRRVNSVDTLAYAVWLEAAYQVTLLVEGNIGVGAEHGPITRKEFYLSVALLGFQAYVQRMGAVTRGPLPQYH